MGLDVSALETALPAETITAVTTTPGGLTTAATQVYVSRTKRQGASKTSPEAWWRPVDPTPDDGGVGLARLAFPYELTIEKDGATLAELRAWRDQVFSHFHGRMKPYVSGIYHAVVDGLDADLHDGEGPAAAVRLLVTFREE